MQLQRFWSRGNGWCS